MDLSGGELQSWLKSLGLKADEAEEVQNCLVREGYKARTELKGKAQPTIKELQAMGIPLRAAKLIHADISDVGGREEVVVEIPETAPPAKPSEFMPRLITRKYGFIPCSRCMLCDHSCSRLPSDIDVCCHQDGKGCCCWGDFTGQTGCERWGWICLSPLILMGFVFMYAWLIFYGVFQLIISCVCCCGLPNWVMVITEYGCCFYKNVYPIEGTLEEVEEDKDITEIKCKDALCCKCCIWPTSPPRPPGGVFTRKTTHAPADACQDLNWALDFPENPLLFSCHQ